MKRSSQQQLGLYISGLVIVILLILCFITCVESVFMLGDSMVVVNDPTVWHLDSHLLLSICNNCTNISFAFIGFGHKHLLHFQ